MPFTRITILVAHAKVATVQPCPNLELGLERTVPGVVSTAEKQQGHVEVVGFHP
jgi:hypothetical protein